MGKNSLSSQILSDVEFEMAFFSYIADSKDFDIIPIPYDDGYVLTGDEFEMRMKDAKKNNIAILLRIDNGLTAVVLNPVTGKFGVVPNDNTSGFLC